MKNNYIFLLIITPGLLGFFFFLRLSWKETRSLPEKRIQINPIILSAALGGEEKTEEFTFYQLPLGLDKAQIHDIIFFADAMWIGTDKGLAKIKDKKLTLYKLFSDWPFEWARYLVPTPHGIVVNIHVANGNTGGNPAGSHIFDLKKEQWQKVGDNVLDQEWLDGCLYQASSKLIRRDPKKDWKEEAVLPSLCSGGASSLVMKAVNHDLWITGDGKTLQTHVDHSYGCGVIRYNPKRDEMVVYKKQDGLNHNYGWDLAGDRSGIFVSHSVKHNRLSFFNFKDGRWTPMEAVGSGNRINISSSQVWLAQATPSYPLRRISRKGQNAHSFPAFFDKNEYVSAIGIDGLDVWFGVYEKHWQDSTYTISSKLCRYTASDP